MNYLGVSAAAAAATILLLLALLAASAASARREAAGGRGGERRCVSGFCLPEDYQKLDIPQYPTIVRVSLQVG